jgi:hypothetical protein
MGVQAAHGKPFWNEKNRPPMIGGVTGTISFYLS